MSAIVYVSDDEHESIKCRMLLDTCATVNFITDREVKRLNIPARNQWLSAQLTT